MNSFKSVVFELESDLYKCASDRVVELRTQELYYKNLLSNEEVLLFLTEESLLLQLSDIQAHISELEKFKRNQLRKRLNLNKKLYKLFSNTVNIDSFNINSFPEFYSESLYVKRVVQRLKEQQIKFLGIKNEEQTLRKLAIKQFINNKFNYNLLKIEELDLEDKPLEFEEDKVVYDKIINKIRRPRVVVDPKLEYAVYRPCEEVIPPRDSTLLNKLKTIIFNLRLNRIKKSSIQLIDYYLNKISKLITYDVDEGVEAIPLSDLSIDPSIDISAYLDDSGNYDPNFSPPTSLSFKDCIESQMETTKEGEDQETNVQKENVILASHSQPSVAKPFTIATDCWDKLCTSQSYQHYDIMERFQEYDKFTWTKDQGINYELFSADLPKAFIAKKSEHPSCILLKNFSYFKFESMEIRVVINSNPFHVGQLQCSFYYGSSSDAHFNDRNNVACLSQCTNAIMDAAGATEVIMNIPYRYYKPFLATRSIDQDTDIANIGRFRILVLNSLMVPKDDTSTVLGTIFFRFVKPQLQGMISRELGNFVSDKEYIESQMFATAHLVDNVLHNVFPDLERDNPPNPAPPIIYAPQNSASWCVADNLPEPTNPLRLDGLGTVPYPLGTSPNEDEMSIDYVKSVFGLLKQVSWDIHQDRGSLLAKIPFSPSVSDDECIKAVASNSTPKYCGVRPPVSVLAELFTNWRGSLEYKLDFISSNYHRGRLIIAYVPRIASLPNITIDQLTACDHLILDLSESKSFTFINRFTADKPWWPRRRIGISSTETLPPGHIYIAVLNRLTATPTVSPKIQFNIYLRGAQDLEFSVPCSPTIALSYNTDILPRNTNVSSYISSYGPPQTSMYIGSWHMFSNKYAILRYGPGSDHITQFQEPHDSLIGKVLMIDSRPGDKLQLKFVEPTKTPPNQTLYIANYLVLIPPIYAWSTTKYYYGAPFPTITSAQRFAATVARDKAHPGYYTFDESKLTLLWDDGDYSNINRSVYWKQSSTDFVFVQAEMEREERVSTSDIKYSVHPPVVTTGSGMFTFGEKFDSLKVLCRRPQLYSETNLISNVADTGLADVSIPILPQGLDLDLSSNYFNQIRDGTIPIILSGYRHGRGSVKMRIEVDAATDKNTTRQIWVQHQPDSNILSLYPKTNLSQYNSRYRFNSGYAYYKQDLALNSIVNITIPYYNITPLMLLQRPNLDVSEDAPHYSLGQLNIGIQYGANDSSGNLHSNIKTFMALGDDFRASTFQGFPPTYRMTEFVESQGLFTPISDWFSSKIEATAVDKVQDVVDAMNRDTEIKNFVESVTSKFPEDKKQIVISALTNIIHAVINPDLKTICWSFISFFASVGMIAISTIQRLYTAFVSFLTYVKNKVSRRETDNRDANIESQGPPIVTEYHLEAAFVSTLVTSVLTLLGAKEKALPKSIPSFAAWMRDGLPKFTLSANGLFIFFKNNLDMLRRVWYWCVSYVMPEQTLNAELDSSNETIVSFVKRVQWCLDARNERQVFNDLETQVTVYELATIAMIMQMKMAVSDIATPKPMFCRLLQKIIDLKDKLVREYKSPPVRYEPFVLGLFGPSKIGKSFMVNDLAYDMMNAIGHKSFEDITYVRTPGNAYWNNLQAQPVVVYDDYLCLQDSVFGLPQVIELFCLKSSAVFNPPKAAIEEKNIRYNPLAVILCSNVSHPKIAGVSDDVAFWRRRDCLVEITKKPEYFHLEPRDIDPEIAKSFGYLNFQFYRDTAKQDSVKGVKPMNFPEFKAELLRRFINYHEKECNAYLARITKTKKNMPKIIDVKADIDTNMQALEDWVKQEFKVVNPGMKIDDIMMGGSDEPVVRLIKQFKEKKLQTEEQTINATGEVTDLRQIYPMKPYSIINNINEQIEKVLNPKLAHKRKCDKESWELYNERISNTVRETASSSKESVENAEHDSSNEDDSENVNCVNIEAQGPSFCDMIDSFVANGELRMDEIKSAKLCKCFGDNSNFYCKVGKKVNVVTDTDCFFLTECGDECLFKKSDRVAFASKLFTRIWNVWDRDVNHLPEIIRVNSGVSVLITDVEEAVDKELGLGNHEHWYNKVWSKIPSFGSVAKFLMYSGIICTLVSYIINSVSSMYSNLFGTDHLIKNNLDNARLYDAETIVYDAKKCNEALVKHWDTRGEIMASDFVKRFTSTLTDEMPASGTSATVGAKKGNPAPIKTFAISQSEEEIHNVVTRLITRNTFWLRLEYINNDNELCGSSMRCLGLCQRFFVCVDHYVNYIKYIYSKFDSAKLYYITSNTMIPLDFNILRFDKSEHSAIFVGRLSTNIPQFRNIVKFFATAHHHQNLSPAAMLVEPNYDTTSNFVIPSIYHFQRIGAQDRIAVNNDDGSVTIADKVYVYPKSKKGLCGSVLVSMGNIQQPIIGIHIAGLREGVKGYSECITYESFKQFISVSLEDSVIPQMSVDGALVRPDTNVQILGVVDSKLSNFPPNQSRLVHSECYEAFSPSTYDSPVLTPSDPRIKDAPFSPMFEGIRNHGFPPIDFPSQEFDIAVKDFRNLILSKVIPQRMNVGKLDLESSVVGIEDVNMYESLDMLTSEGFPFTKLRPKGSTNKAWLFDINYSSYPKLNSVNPILQEVLDSKEKMRINNIIPQTVFTACLKDAKLPKDKVLIPGKTRIFSISPVDFTIQQRQYFMDFSVAHQVARLDVEHAIGINIKGIEVGELVNHLINHSPYLVTGDYSKFGDTLMSKCVKAVYDIMCDWYEYNGDVSQENRRVREILCEEVMHATILAMNVMYKGYCGMPSGNPLTVVINSMVNSLYIRVMWLLLAKKYDTLYYSMKSFHEHVRLITYGDDLIMSVSAEVLEWFNGRSLQDMFALFDIKFTDSSKSAAAVAYCSITDKEATFLKHLFVPHPFRQGQWLAKLDDQALLEIPNWTWNTHKDIRESSLECCRAFLEEAYGHGEDFYDSYLEKITEFWRARGVFFTALSWRELDIRIFGL